MLYVCYRCGEIQLKIWGELGDGRQPIVAFVYMWQLCLCGLYDRMQRAALKSCIRSITGIYADTHSLYIMFVDTRQLLIDRPVCTVTLMRR